MSCSVDCMAVADAIARDDYQAAERMLSELLAGVWRTPALCHLVSVFHFWRALDAETAGNGSLAAQHWHRMIPHLVYALENSVYMEHLRATREQVYGQEIEVEKLGGAREDAYRFVEECFKELDQRYAATAQETERLRIQQTLDSWRLEVIAARLVTRLGGIPDGDIPAQCVFAGPMFARRYGFYDHATNYIAALEVREKSLIEELIVLFTALGDGEDQGPTPRVKREVGYCFSHLALPFLYYHERQFGRALEALTQLAQSGNDSAQEMVGKAAKTRQDARQLSAEIRVAVGSDFLQRGGTLVHEALAFWGDALKDLEILDAQVRSPVRRRKPKAKVKMRELVRQRVQNLASSNHWDEALLLAEGFARVLPEQETLRDLIALLVNRAHHAAVKDNEDAVALDYLRRAKLLAPTDRNIKEHLLNLMAKRVQDLKAKDENRAAAETCMDIYSLSKELIKEHKKDLKQEQMNDPRSELAERARVAATYWLHELLQKLTGEADQEFARIVFMFLTKMVIDTGDDSYDHLESIRLARRAQERILRGEIVEAFTDIDGSIQRNPKNDQIKDLYETLAAHIIDRLCDQGSVDRAAEIAEKAHRTLSGSQTIDRCRTRVMLRRLGPEKLLSEDPEEIAGIIAVLESWLGEDANDQELQKRGRRYAAVIDRDLCNETQLDNVQTLMEKGHHRMALELLDNLKLHGMDAARAKYFAVSCYRRLNELDKALVVADELVEELPFEPVCRRARGEVLTLLGRFEQAEDDLSYYRENHIDDYGVVRDLAFNAFRSGRYRDAMRDLQLARENGVNPVEGILCEALCLMQLGRETEIPEIVAQASEQHQKDPWYSQTLLWACDDLSDEQLLALASTNGQTCEACFYVGEKARIHGQSVRARELMLRCLKTEMRHF